MVLQNKDEFYDNHIPDYLLYRTDFHFILSKQSEDEYITQIRESSFVSAMLIGSLLLILMTLLLYGFAYLWFSLYDVYIFLILFICIFDYRMYKLKKSTRDEK